MIAVRGVILTVRIVCDAENPPQKESMRKNLQNKEKREWSRKIRDTLPTLDNGSDLDMAVA